MIGVERAKPRGWVWFCDECDSTSRILVEKQELAQRNSAHHPCGAVSVTKVESDEEYTQWAKKLLGFD